MSYILKRASWLELFYDLAYVALVAQLTYLISSNFSDPFTLILSLIIGYTIFLAWWGTTANRNLQDSEGLTDRIFIQIQMIIALLMSVTLFNVYESQHFWFFTLLSLIRLIQVGMMIRMRCCNPNFPFSISRLLLVAISAMIWLSISFVPHQFILYFGIIAAFLDSIATISSGTDGKSDVYNKAHLQERLGLFIMLVIGESMLVVAIASSVSVVGIVELFIILSGICLMICLWWLYFDHLESKSSNEEPMFSPYFYGHIFLYLGIILTSAGYRNLLLDIENLISITPLLTGGITLCAIGIFFIRIAWNGWTKHILYIFLYTLLTISLLAFISTLSNIHVYSLLIGITVILSIFTILDFYRRHFIKK